MAANIYASNSDTPNGEINFLRAVDYLNVYVATGVTFSLSLDEGEHYLTLPPGFNSFKIGPTKKILVSSTGVWELIAVQA